MYILEILLQLIRMCPSIQEDLLHTRIGKKLQRILNKRGVGEW